MPVTRPLAAAASILMAMFLIGYIDNYVVTIAENGGLWQFHALRTAMALPVLGVIAVAMSWRLRPLSWKAVAARSFFNGTAMMMYFASLAFLPITQSVAGLFTSPLFVLLISGLILGERSGPVRTLAAPVGFVGVLLVLQPWSDAFSPWAVVAITAGLFYAIGAIGTRRWCSAETTGSLLGGAFLVMGCWGVLGMAVLSLVNLDVPVGADGFVLRGWVSPNGPFLFWTLVQALGSLAAVALITRAYQWGEAPFVAVFEYGLLVFVTFWAFVLWGERPDAMVVMGIALIVLSGAAIAVAERQPPT